MITAHLVHFKLQSQNIIDDTFCHCFLSKHPLPLFHEAFLGFQHLKNSNNLPDFSS